MRRFIFTLLLLVILPAVPRARADEPLPRAWTNSLGIKMRATFVRMEGDQVTLLLDNGQMVTMSVDKFSPADQDYIHGLQTAAATPAPAMPSDTPVAGPPQPVDAQPGASQPAPPGQKSILLRPALIHAPDPRVKPKAEIYVPFPELGQSRTADEPMAMRIRIPASYSPDRPVPLIVWLAGGDGNSRFNTAEALVNEEDFVLVGMNYPASIPEPQYATVQGKIDQIWALHEKMLAKLQDMIPNLDPRMRVIVGFSNGAHVIGGCLAHQIDGLSHYFNVFVLVEGGNSDSFNYPPLPGRYYYVATGGAQGGRGVDFNTMLANYARKAGMNVETRIMEGVGHDFPDAEQARVRSWLENTVVPAQLSAP